MPFSTPNQKQLDQKYLPKVHALIILHACGLTRCSGFGSNSSGTEQYIAPSGGSAPSSSFSGSTSAPGSGKYAGFGNPEFQGKDRSGSLDMSSIQDAGAKAMSFMAEGLSKLKGKIDETAKQNASPTVGSSSLYQNPSTQVEFQQWRHHASTFPSLTLLSSRPSAPSLLAAVALQRIMLVVLIEAATVTPLLQRLLAPPKALMAPLHRLPAA